MALLLPLPWGEGWGEGIPDGRSKHDKIAQLQRRRGHWVRAFVAARLSGYAFGYPDLP